MNAPVLGLVGVGNWGQYILRDLRTLGARVHAVARDEASIARANREGAESIVPDIESLPSCDAFVVANRTIDHLDAVRRLLPRGRPIFVEKPLTPDVEGAQALPPEAFGRVFVMHKWRYHPGILELARIVRSEEFGPLLGLRTFRVGGPVRHTDVNPVWVLLPHDLSIAREILGEMPRPISAMRDPLTAVGEGLIARLKAPLAKVDVVMEISAGHVQSLRRVVLSCRDAVCELRDEQYDAIRIRRRGAPVSEAPESRSVSRDLPLYKELEAFLVFVGGGPAPHTALREELQFLETIRALQGLA